MAGPAVAVSGVRVGYGSFVVLEDVDLTVAGGEIVAVTGVNGAGKSTLLSCLAGLHRPAAGTVSVLGGPPRDDAAFWRAVALVADQPTWYPGLTLREHLELVRLTHEPVRGWCLPTDELIEVFGLPGRADAVPTDLSSGQRQRLSLAAALARPSRLLLLDEPEQSLDPGFRKQLAGLLREYAGGRRDRGHGHPRPRLRRGRRGAAGADLRGAGGHARDGPVIASAAAAGPPRVAAIRSFIRRRRRRPWYDWYSTGFAVVLAVILLWDLLAQPFGRLTAAPAGSAGRRRPRRWRAPHS